MYNYYLIFYLNIYVKNIIFDIEKVIYVLNHYYIIMFFLIFIFCQKIFN